MKTHFITFSINVVKFMMVWFRTTEKSLYLRTDLQNMYMYVLMAIGLIKVRLKAQWYMCLFMYRKLLKSITQLLCLFLYSWKCQLS